MPSNPRAALAASLRQVAVLLTQVDDKGTPTWHPQGRYQRDAYALLRAGIAMLTNGETAERQALEWAATGLVLPATDPGSRSADCGCDPDDPKARCPHGTATERGALNGPDEWQGRAARLRQQRELLAENAHDYEKLVDLISRVGDRLGRVSTVEVCSGCGQTISLLGDDKPKRLDGDPYHNTSENPCWWRAYNATRGRRGA